VVFNKIDLTQERPAKVKGFNEDAFYISAATGEKLNDLVKALTGILFAK
jgi:50S ribosomal subunit-associated GTPase HflX